MKALLIILSILSITYIQAEERNEEICFLSDKRFKLKSYQKRFENRQFATIKKIFPSVAKDDFDILLSENADKINKFKRIYISNAYSLFSQSHLAGIKKFAKDGGLVISSSGLCIVDKNGDFIYNKGDLLLRRKGSIAGVIKFSSVKIKNIKIKASCPISKGMEEGEIIKVNWNSGRTHNVSAEIIVSGDALYKNKWKFKNIPIVTYKKIDKGAIIFLNVVGNRQVFLKNSIAPLTLDWLVDSE